MSKALHYSPLVKIPRYSQTKQSHTVSDRWAVAVVMPRGGFWYGLSSRGKIVTSSIRKLIDMDEER